MYMSGTQFKASGQSPGDPPGVSNWAANFGKIADGSS